MLYEKDKSHRITLRLSEAQFQHVKQSADVLGVSPSDFLRMVVNATMYGTKVADQAAQAAKQQEEEHRRENEASIQHNLV